MNLLTTTVTTSSIFSDLSSIITMILSAVGNVITTITGNPLFYVPVLLALGAGVASIAIKIVRKLGVNGIGKRSRRRRTR